MIYLVLRCVAENSTVEQIEHLHYLISSKLVLLYSSPLATSSDGYVAGLNRRRNMISYRISLKKGSRTR